MGRNILLSCYAIIAISGVARAEGALYQAAWQSIGVVRDQVDLLRKLIQLPTIKALVAENGVVELGRYQRIDQHFGANQRMLLGGQLALVAGPKGRVDVALRQVQLKLEQRAELNPNQQRELVEDALRGFPVDGALVNEVTYGGSEPRLNLKRTTHVDIASFPGLKKSAAQAIADYLAEHPALRPPTKATVRSSTPWRRVKNAQARKLLEQQLAKAAIGKATEKRLHYLAKQEINQAKQIAFREHGGRLEFRIAQRNTDRPIDDGTDSYLRFYDRKAVLVLHKDQLTIKRDWQSIFHDSPWNRDYGHNTASSEEVYKAVPPENARLALEAIGVERIGKDVLLLHHRITDRPRDWKSTGTKRVSVVRVAAIDGTGKRHDLKQGPPPLDFTLQGMSKARFAGFVRELRRRPAVFSEVLQQQVAATTETLASYAVDLVDPRTKIRAPKYQIVSEKEAWSLIDQRLAGQPELRAILKGQVDSSLSGITRWLKRLGGKRSRYAVAQRKGVLYLQVGDNSFSLDARGLHLRKRSANGDWLQESWSPLSSKAHLVLREGGLSKATSRSARVIHFSSLNNTYGKVDLILQSGQSSSIAPRSIRVQPHQQQGKSYSFAQMPRAAFWGLAKKLTR